MAQTSPMGDVDDVVETKPEVDEVGEEDEKDEEEDEKEEDDGNLVVITTVEAEATLAIIFFLVVLIKLSICLFEKSRRKSGTSSLPFKR